MDIKLDTQDAILAEKFAITQGRPATLFQIIQLAEKLERSYNTAFEAKKFRQRIQRVQKRNHKRMY